jgi:hypothetical protein
MGYRHTQTGWAILGAFVPILVILAIVAIKPPDGEPAPMWPIVALLAVIGWLLSSLTVEVTPERLTAAFGPGWPRVTVPVADIAACEPVVNKWWYGWGIHGTPRGVLYNVSGMEAVELQLKSGKLVRIGTDEPRALCEAIRQAAAAR